MNYRILPHGKDKISEIGLGSGGLAGTEKEIIRVIKAAMEKGINYFDILPSKQETFFAYAKAFEGCREKISMQMHFGAVYERGKYGRTRDIRKIKEQFEWQLKTLHTSYTDMGYVHCVDEEDDLLGIMNGGLWDYMRSLKENGYIRHLGFSSHNPQIARKILDTGLVDIFMFSINPSYDYHQGGWAMGERSERIKFYQDCECMGIGIIAMKPFAGGQLLNKEMSVFKKELNENQCLQYALDRPAVLSVLPGVRNMDDLQRILRFLTANTEEKDYSIIGESMLEDAQGICVYCNHCQPCPAELDIGLINKFYDLAKAGDQMAAEHYHDLKVHAEDCIKCGHCESYCPFGVKQKSRMLEIAEYFKKDRV